MDVTTVVLIFFGILIGLQEWRSRLFQEQVTLLGELIGLVQERAEWSEKRADAFHEFSLEVTKRLTGADDQEFKDWLRQRRVN